MLNKDQKYFCRKIARFLVMPIYLSDCCPGDHGNTVQTRTVKFGHIISLDKVFQIFW